MTLVTVQNSTGVDARAMSLTLASTRFCSSRIQKTLRMTNLRPCLAGVIWPDDNINLNSDYNSQTPTQIFVI